MSDFLMQVIDRHSGEIAASWAPGTKAEVDFIEAVVNRVGIERVGVFTPVGTVQDKVRKCLQDEIFKLKASVRPSHT